MTLQQEDNDQSAGSVKVGQLISTIERIIAKANPLLEEYGVKAMLGSYDYDKKSLKIASEQELGCVECLACGDVGVWPIINRLIHELKIKCSTDDIELI